jgi:prepilin-type N-terminal cleavage/methylation domain-containing protein
MKPRRNRGFTLVELLIVIVILGILMALVLPAIIGAERRARVAQCQNNLSQLYKAVISYSAAYGGRTPIGGSAGSVVISEFWQGLAQDPENVLNIQDATGNVDWTKAAIFECPVENIPDVVGGSTIDYRGPSGYVSPPAGITIRYPWSESMNDRQRKYLLSDRNINHSSDGSAGGNAVLKDSSVTSISGKSTEWSGTNPGDVGGDTQDP